MSIVRRWYIYLVSAISLQTVTWAVIALLRNLLISPLNPQPTAIAFQISVILVGLPIFLAHWLWGQRLVKQSFEELGATLRRFYLYGTLAAFLGPFTANVYDSVSGRFLLIPQGTRMIGRYSSEVLNGQNRVLIAWQRLILPNGNSIVLEAMSGTDAAGVAGMADRVDYHLDRLAAATLLSTLIALGGNLSVNTQRDSEQLDIVGTTVAQQASRVGQRIIDRLTATEKLVAQENPNQAKEADRRFTYDSYLSRGPINFEGRVPIILMYVALQEDINRRTGDMEKQRLSGQDGTGILRETEMLRQLQENIRAGMEEYAIEDAEVWRKHDTVGPRQY